MAQSQGLHFTQARFSLHTAIIKMHPMCYGYLVNMIGFSHSQTITGHLLGSSKNSKVSRKKWIWNRMQQYSGGRFMPCWQLQKWKKHWHISQSLSLRKPCTLGPKRRGPKCWGPRSRGSNPPGRTRRVQNAGVELSYHHTRRAQSLMRNDQKTNLGVLDI